MSENFPYSRLIRPLRRPILLTASMSLAVLGAALAGCGGAGTTLGGNNTPTLNSSLPPNSRTQGATKEAAAAAAASVPQTRLGVFATATEGKDSSKEFAPGYDHVWMTLRKIEVLDANEQATTVFADTDGREIDLKALADARTPRFALLTGAPLASGTAKAYQRVRLTFGKSLLLLKPGENAAQNVALADALPRDAEGMPTMTMPLTRARNLGSGKEDLILAFGTLTVKDDKASFSVRDDVEDISALSDTARQVPATFAGTIGGVTGTAPTQTFTLLGENGTAVAVQTVGGTSLFKGDGGSNPVIADGVHVVVRGTLDASSRRVAAAQVRIDSAEAKGDADRVIGTVSHVDSDAGTLVIEPREVAGGVVPTQAAVTVTLTKDTTLRSRGGLPLEKEAFWKAIEGAKGSGSHADLLVEVEGTYDAALSTLSAHQAKLDSVSPAVAHEVVIAGTASSIDADKRTLNVGTPLAEWDGIAAPAGTKGIPIVLTAATAFADEEGKTLASAHLLDGAKDATKIVRVTGLYADGKVTATRVELRPAPPKPVAAADATKADGSDKPVAAGLPGAAAKKPEAVKPAPGKPAPEDGGTVIPAAPSPAVGPST